MAGAHLRPDEAFAEGLADLGLAGSSEGGTLADPSGALRERLVELNDLKRVRSAGRRGSIAERLFAAAWAALAGGAEPERVMRRVAAAGLAAARLGDLDAAYLAAAEVGAEELAAILARGFDEFAGPILAGGPGAGLAAALRAELAAEDDLAHATPPGFVAALAGQPRAGVTCPGRPRIVLEPPENHAEHCLMVALYGVVLAPRYGADPTVVFLAGLAHHFHNAGMPDAGFTGEMLLGDALERIMAVENARALAELDGPLRGRVEAARAVLPDAGTPEGRAFHAADVIDRVVQIAQHLRAASLTMGTVLGEMELVHAGPVKTFHDDVLSQLCLLDGDGAQGSGAAHPPSPEPPAAQPPAAAGFAAGLA